MLCVVLKVKKVGDLDICFSMHDSNLSGGAWAPLAEEGRPQLMARGGREGGLRYNPPPILYYTPNPHPNFFFFSVVDNKFSLRRPSSLITQLFGEDHCTFFQVSSKIAQI